MNVFVIAQRRGDHFLCQRCGQAIVSIKEVKEGVVAKQCEECGFWNSIQAAAVLSQEQLQRRSD